MVERTIEVHDTSTQKPITGAQLTITQPNQTKMVASTDEKGVATVDPYCVEQGMPLSVVAKAYQPTTLEAEDTDWRIDAPVKVGLRPSDELSEDIVIVTRWDKFSIPGIYGGLRFFHRDKWSDIMPVNSRNTSVDRAHIKSGESIRVGDVCGNETEIKFLEVQDGIYAVFSYTPVKRHECPQG